MLGFNILRVEQEGNGLTFRQLICIIISEHERFELNTGFAIY